MKMTYKQIYQEALEADKAWHAALVQQFGKQAGDKRYTMEGQGKPGSEMRRLYETFRDKTAKLRACHLTPNAH